MFRDNLDNGEEYVQMRRRSDKKSEKGLLRSYNYNAEKEVTV